MATTLPKENRDEWLQQRRNYLGGTDVAAIVGENQFK
jgi:predicted phage-related endonuclease